MIFILLFLSFFPARVEAAPVSQCTPNVVSYDLVYTRNPRFGDTTNAIFTDTVIATILNPGADLRLLHPDCTEDVLFPLPEHQTIIDAPIGNGSVADPNVSFDGQWVVFAYYHDLKDVNDQRCAGGGLCISKKGADLYRVNVRTKETVRLTRQEFTPNTGNGAQFANCQGGAAGGNCPRVGVFNTGPGFIAATNPLQPDIVFTSTRNNFIPARPFRNHERVMQLYRMSWDGTNQEQIGYLNLAQAQHPIQLLDGRLMFTSWESMGMRDLRLFPLWLINPDGTGFAPLAGFGELDFTFHFATQMSNGDIVSGRYYVQNNNGFGDLVRFPLDPPGPDFLPVHAPNTYMPLQRVGQVDLTNWTDTPFGLADDHPAPCTVGGNPFNQLRITSCASASRVGKVTHPAVAPGDAVLLVYSPGPANHNDIYVKSGSALPFYDAGIYVMPANKAADGTAKPADLKKVVNNPAYNEQWPRPVVPYSALFPGKAQPFVWPDNQNLGEPNHALPANTPFGLIGSSSLIWRDTGARVPKFTSDPDPFNAVNTYNWLVQGADAGVYSFDDIAAVRILAIEPATDRSYGNAPGFRSAGAERLRILGDIPVRHEGVKDATGNTDTSFLVRIPADTPFTFQTLDRNGMVVNMAQTWHQVRPGEVHYDCGGCHAHSKTPLDFDSTVAGRAGFQPSDLTKSWKTVEFNRDLKPILSAHCATCHGGTSPAAGLNLTNEQQLIPANRGEYHVPNLSKYVRAFQARGSLLTWYAYNQRLDGRQNSTRGDDLDYTQNAVHANLLSATEQQTLACWIDLGAPISTASTWSYFEDDLRPTLWLSPTLQQARSARISALIVGMYDGGSGLDLSSLTVTLNGQTLPVGQVNANGLVAIPLPQSLDFVASKAVVRVSVKDKAGHVSIITRQYGGVSTLASQLIAKLHADLTTLTADMTAAKNAGLTVENEPLT